MPASKNRINTPTNRIYPHKKGYILEIFSLKLGLFTSEFSSESLPIVKSFKWCVSGPKGNEYVVTNTNKPVLRLHRLVLGVSDSSDYVDHINGDRLDNRKENLRICTKSQNAMNTKRSDKLKGIRTIISKRTGLVTYQVTLKVDYKPLYFGAYKTLRDAVIVYNTASSFHHGEFGIQHEIPND